MHTNWRLAVIGVALGLGTAAVAYVEQYLWILFVLALAALGIIFAVGTHARSTRCEFARMEWNATSRAARRARLRQRSERVGRADQQVNRVVGRLELEVVVLEILVVDAEVAHLAVQGQLGLTS